MRACVRLLAAKMKVRSPGKHGNRRHSSTVLRLWMFGLLLTTIVTFLVLCVVLPSSEDSSSSSGHLRFVASHLKVGGGLKRSARLHEQLQPQPEHRIAMLLPYTAPSDNVASILPYMVTFCFGAAGARDIADFIVLHTGVLSQWPILRTECPSNVIFVDLETHAALAERLLRVVDHKYYPGDTSDTQQASHNQNEDDRPKMPREELLELVTSYIKVNPYGLVEFKPALGHIFQDFLNANNYTHWGYTDFDVLFGDLSRWITLDELTNYDIVTYTYGDQHRLYMRGQFTIHKNDETKINQLWRKCDYLTAMDERFKSIVQHDQKYHVESAEGCYSAAVLDQNDIAVKFAVKAWTDIFRNDTAYSHGLFISRSTNGERQVLYKQENLFGNGRVSSPVSRLPSDWFVTKDRIYKDPSIPIQREIGVRHQIFPEKMDSSVKDCMYWALPKYQSKLCLTEDEVTSNDTILWINGKLWKQAYEDTALQAPSVNTAPLFHFQEWKRSYQYGPLASMKLSSQLRIFCLTPEGAVPVIDTRHSSNRSFRAASPLGLAPMTSWSSVDQNDRSQLPGLTYCVSSTIDRSSKHARCTMSASWHDERQTILLSMAPGWKEIEIEQDVSFVLCLGISEEQLENSVALDKVINHLKLNLLRWRGQPSVVIIALASTGSKAMTIAIDLVKEKLLTADVDLSLSLVALVVREESETSSKTQHFSRKALFNMAIDAVPTRWYLSGLEIDRGLSISAETMLFAYRAVASSSRLHGTIFVIPQFGAVDNKPLTTGINKMDELFSARDLQQVVPLRIFDESCEENNGHLHILESEWWSMTQDLDQEEGGKHVDEATRAAQLEKLQDEILKLNSANISASLNDSPVLLIDNLGPHDGILTNDIAREVESFIGQSCYNGLRLQQLALLGFSYEILAGAFVFSSETTPYYSSNKDCRRCHISGDDDRRVLDNIAFAEIKRVAKTAILWAEILESKH